MVIHWILSFGNKTVSAPGLGMVMPWRSMLTIVQENNSRSGKPAMDLTPLKKPDDTPAENSDPKSRSKLFSE